MRIIKYILIIAFTLGKKIRSKYLSDYDIDGALAMKPSKPDDYTFRYFLLKRFRNDIDGAVSTLLCADGENIPVQLMLAHMNSNKNPLIKIESEAQVFNIFGRMAHIVSKDFLANRLNFYMPVNLEKDENNDLEYIITNVWSRNKEIVDKFFIAIHNCKFKLEKVKNELKFLSKHGFKRAFGLLGDIYYYGFGTPVNYEKAMEFYMKGRKAGDVYSYLGIARILGRDGYADPKQALAILNEGLAIQKDPETMFHKYLVLKSLNADSFELKVCLNYAAYAGYLPAVYQITYENVLNNTLSYPIVSYKSVTILSRYFIKIYDLAYHAFCAKNYKKALILYLYLSEFDLDVAIQNALYIMERYNVLDDQDKIYFSFLSELSETKTEFYKRLGDCYYNGIGTDVSYTKAFGYYFSSISNSDESLYNVAYMFETGKGVPQNLMLAFSYISKPLITNNSYLVFLYAKCRIIFKIIFYNRILVTAFTLLLSFFYIFRIFFLNN